MTQRKKDFKEIYFEDAYKGMYNTYAIISNILILIIALPFYLIQQIIKYIGYLNNYKLKDGLGNGK